MHFLVGSHGTGKLTHARRLYDAAKRHGLLPVVVWGSTEAPKDEEARREFACVGARTTARSVKAFTDALVGTAKSLLLEGRNIIIIIMRLAEPERRDEVRGRIVREDGTVMTVAWSTGVTRNLVYPLGALGDARQGRVPLDKKQIEEDMDLFTPLRAGEPFDRIEPTRFGLPASVAGVFGLNVDELALQSMLMYARHLVCVHDCADHLRAAVEDKRVPGCRRRVVQYGEVVRTDERCTADILVRRGGTIVGAVVVRTLVRGVTPHAAEASLATLTSAVAERYGLDHAHLVLRTFEASSPRVVSDYVVRRVRASRAELTACDDDIATALAHRLARDKGRLEAKIGTYAQRVVQQMRPPWVPRTMSDLSFFGLLRSFYHANSFARLKATQTGFVERDGALAARSIAAQARHWGETLHESITITMSTIPPPGIAVGEELRRPKRVLSFVLVFPALGQRRPSSSASESQVAVSLTRHAQRRHAYSNIERITNQKSDRNTHLTPTSAR